MVQVLKRADAILSLLGSRGTVPFGDIVKHTGLKKTTLSNILKTLLGLRYIHRAESGSYTLGPALLELAGRTIRKDAVLALAEEQTRRLAHATQEAAVITMYDGGELTMIAKAVYDRGVTVNTDMFKSYTGYTTATGRILLAHLSESDLKAFIRMKGWPREAWGGIHTETALETELARIRKAGIEIKAPNEGEVQALAVPVFGADGKVWAALGVYLPKERFKGSHKTRIIRQLKQAGNDISCLLKEPVSL